MRVGRIGWSISFPNVKCFLMAAVIPGEYVRHWQQQVLVPYELLSEKEKQSDRDEVAHILPIIGEHMQQAVIAISNAQMKQGVRLHPNAMLRAIEEEK